MLEKPMSGDRDAVDLISTVGAGRKFGSAVTMSVEAVGQDLEGFWDPQEKEGGARLMVGPSLSIAPPTARWQLTLGGGPIVRATHSDFSELGRSTAADAQRLRATVGVRLQLVGRVAQRRLTRAALARCGVRRAGRGRGSGGVARPACASRHPRREAASETCGGSRRRRAASSARRSSTSRPATASA